MKKFLILLAALAVLALPASATPVWVADAQTGCQVCFSGTLPVPASLSWSGGAVDGKADGRGQLKLVYRNGLTVEGTADMRLGVLHGQASLRWSDGSSYEGGFENNRFSGEGKLTFADGATYAGGYANGGYEGHGVLTERSGRVKYDGTFERNTFKPKPFDGKVTPSIGGLLDGFQGIPWGSDQAAVVKAMEKIGYRVEHAFDTVEKNAKNGWGKEVPGSSLLYCLYSDDPKAPLKNHCHFFFFDNRLAVGWLHFYASEDDLLKKFDEVKAALSAKYGPPDEEKGKFLDREAIWYFGVADSEPNSILLTVLSPQAIRVEYANGALRANQKAKPQPAGGLRL
jgi:hypothetical protein